MAEEKPASPPNTPMPIVRAPISTPDQEGVRIRGQAARPADRDTRDMAGARAKDIDPAIVKHATEGPMARMASAVRSLLGFGARAGQAPSPAGGMDEPTERPVPPSQVQRDPATNPLVTQGFFGPGQPMQPVTQPEEVGGARAFDYPAGYNLTTHPRRDEYITFDVLRDLATYDLVRLCVETRKDQIAKVGWSILPKKPPGQKHPPKPDDRCREIEKFLRKPDGVLPWEAWVRALIEETLVLDAVALYRRRTAGGQPYALELVDGASITLKLDITGRRPLPPQPAYQQILKGVPAVEWTTEELTYAVRNPRANKVYGLSPVEQIVTYINIGLRRMAKQLQTYTEGNIPEAFMSVPEQWTSQQIQEFQRYWDSIMSIAANKRRMKFVPAGMNYWPTHPDGQLMDQFDEWLARICTYAFSLPPLPFVKMMNRATADTAYETALEEGLAPLLAWLKNLIDGEIEHFLGAAGYELVWDDIRKVDPTEQRGLDLNDLRAGVLGIDEIRTGRGLDPLGLPHLIWGIGPLGVMSIESFKKALEQGLDMPAPPPPPDMMGMGGVPGDPNADPLANADPRLLEQLGIGGGGQQQLPPPEDDDMGDEEGGMPPQRQPVDLATAMQRVKASPQALRLLRSAEQRYGRR